MSPRHWLDVLALAWRQMTPGPEPTSRKNGCESGIQTPYGVVAAGPNGVSAGTRPTTWSSVLPARRRRLRLRVVGRVDIEDVERPFQTDLDDGWYSGPGKVVHLRRERDEAARLQRLTGVTV